MLIEAIGRPLTYRWPEGEVRLVPGQPLDLPETRAKRLLEKAAGRVRMVPGQTTLIVGSMVTWDSPLFGLLSGPVLEVLDSGITVQHPLTEIPCTIPKGWLR